MRARPSRGCSGLEKFRNVWAARVTVREKTGETVSLHSGLRVIACVTQTRSRDQNGTGMKEKRKGRREVTLASLTSPTGIVENLF